MEAENVKVDDEAQANAPEENPKLERSNSVQNRMAQAKLKSKRPRSVSISEPEPSKSHIKFSKNSRRSRAGFGRGLPKKGGAGGKGVWGKPGLEGEGDAPAAVDLHDPNYDSDSMTDNVKLVPVTVELTEEEIKKLAQSLVLEYFEHGDTAEVDASLTEHWLSIGIQRRYLIVVTMVEVAMEHKSSHREMTSVLISDLYQECLTQTDIMRGFEALLKALPDLALDCPEAPTILGNFMARCVADDCLPPKYLTSHKGTLECPLAIQALDHADVLISMKHGMVLLDNVWGCGGAGRPVRSLIKQMALLLLEFLTSGDAQEAIRCLKELEVPHFHHELVYEAVTLAVERSDETTLSRLVGLLKAMADACVLSPNQVSEGFARVYENLDDMQLDVPNAYALVERVVNLSFTEGVISKETKKKMPVRGRKRFVSEGDGGRIKDRGDDPLAY